MRKKIKINISWILTFALVINLLIGLVAAGPIASAASVSFAPSSTARFEAENAQLSNNVVVYDNQSGASGGKAVGNINADGRYIKFNNLPATSSFAVRYATVNTGSISIYINDTYCQALNFVPTGGLQSYVPAVFNISLNSGDSVKIQRDAGDTALNVDFLECTLSKNRLEGENGVFTGNAKAFTGQANASGNAVAGTINSVGASVTFNNLPKSNSVTICYSSRYSGIIGVYLNGVRVHSLAFTATGTGSAAWTGPGHFKTIVLDMVLSEGDSLKIQFDSGDAILNIDYIECNFAAARYEAESAALSGNASVFTGQVNASGYSVVGNINAAGSSVLFADLPETSSVSLRYASANSGTINLYVNGTHSKTLVFSSTGSWSVFKTIALELSISAGSSLKVQFNSGDMALNLDYIELDPLISIPGSPGGEIIAAGPLHTLMTDSYSSFFYVWGGNSEGELGNGTATGSLKPVWMNHMTDFVAVSAGGDSYTGTYFSAALKTDGTVWTWGGNDFGQLGNGATVGSSTPVQVSGLSDIVAVSCGGSHMTALKSDGTVWTWGNNQYGQLGNGTVTGSSTPVRASGLINVVAIAAGGRHTVALKRDGTLLAWGYNADGQLGNGEAVNSSLPKKVQGLDNIVSIDAGYGHTAALTLGGEVWCWGANGFGQLGNNSKISAGVPVKVAGLSGVSSVSCGGGHTASVKTDGTVWCWGLNASGQLGDGTKTDRLAPIKVDTLSGITSVSCGISHTVAFKSDLLVFSWGSNASGQLGDGTTADSSVPVQSDFTRHLEVPSRPSPGERHIAAGDLHTTEVNIDGSVWAWGSNYLGQLGNGTKVDSGSPVPVNGLTDIVAVDAGGFPVFTYSYAYTMALRADGTVWAWGYNGNGQLGNGTTTNSSIPVQVTGLTNIVAISCGEKHSAALKADGTLWIWGNNSYWQLGVGEVINATVPFQMMSGVVAVSCGGNHTVVLKEDGSMWAWGENTYGQFGDGTTISSAIPVKISHFTNVAAVSAGLYNTMALKTDGSVWVSGRNYSGQLGNGTSSNSSVPVRVSGINSAVDISCGNNFCMAALENGTVKTWGWGGYGLLGNGGTANSAIPVEVSGLTDVIAVSAGTAHAVALKSDGSVWDWGYNKCGQLGDDTKTDRKTPVKVPPLSLRLPIPAIPEIPSEGDWEGDRKLAAGFCYTVALNYDGSVWAWGWNNVGQLGNGSNTDSSVPVHISGLEHIAAVACGSYHSVALKAGGTVWAWGQNTTGQLGNGTLADSSVPVEVAGLVNVTAISAGEAHTAALKSDGTVWTWGANDVGQLGDGTVNSSPVPVQVTGLNGIVAISCGSYHTVALKSDGTVWAWGANYAGQLGNGTTDDSVIPVKVIGISDVTSVSSGANHVAASKYDGTVWAWGSNFYGELGNGENVDSSIPTRVTGLTNVAIISAGISHTVALKVDGTLWGWGNNEDGELGNGTTENTYIPVKVNTVTEVASVAGGVAHTVALKTDGTSWGWGLNMAGELGNNAPIWSAVKSPVQITYCVTYFPNTADSGEVPVDKAIYWKGADLTVSGNTGSLSKTEATFNGWNTEADGTGTSYAPDADLTVGTQNIVLYAQWNINSYCLVFDANGGEGGITITAHYGDPLSKPFVKREGYTLVGWEPAIPAAVDGDAVYVAQWVETSMTVKHAGDDKIAVEIRGFSTTYNYQIWSYQRVTSDLELNGGEDVPANQWVLSMPYTPGSAGSASGSTLTFLIDKFQSPNGNYGIVLKIADEEQRYLYELANSYTSGDICEAKITKIYVDGEYVNGSAQDDSDPYTDIRLVKDIADGSVNIKVIGNLEDLIYSATVVETAENLTAVNGNEFTWDISSLEPRTYTVNVKAENETSSDTRTIRFTLFTLEETEYAEIDELVVTGGGVISNLYNILTTNIGIKPGSNKLGYFFYKIGEPGRKAQIKSDKSYNDTQLGQDMDAYGYYQLTGLVNRDSGLTNPAGWDDGIIKFFSIKRSSAPSSLMVEVNGNEGNSFTLYKGLPITFEANANIAGINGEAVQYSFWRYDAKGYVLVKDWSSDNFLTWTPGKVGDYNIQVRAKGELAKSYEVAKSVAVSIVDPIDSKANGVTITVNEAELNANAKAHVPIMIKASATNAANESLLYKFYIHDEFMLTQQLRNYSPSGDVLWTPRKAGTYEIMVLVKNDVSYGKYDAIKRVTVTVE